MGVEATAALGIVLNRQPTGLIMRYPNVEQKGRLAERLRHEITSLLLMKGEPEHELYTFSPSSKIFSANAARLSSEIVVTQDENTTTYVGVSGDLFPYPYKIDPQTGNVEGEINAFAIWRVRRDNQTEAVQETFYFVKTNKAGLTNEGEGDLTMAEIGRAFAVVKLVDKICPPREKNLADLPVPRGPKYEEFIRAGLTALTVEEEFIAMDVVGHIVQPRLNRPVEPEA